MRLSLKAQRVKQHQGHAGGFTEPFSGVRPHPIPHMISCQQKICNFYRRFKLAQRTEREGMKNFLGPEGVIVYPQAAMRWGVAEAGNQQRVELTDVLCVSRLRVGYCWRTLK